MNEGPGIYADIEEVQEAGRTSVNVFLANGYRLLAVISKATLDHRGGMPFVRRDALYVVGRPAGVPHLAWGQVDQQRDAVTTTLVEVPSAMTPSVPVGAEA